MPSYDNANSRGKHPCVFQSLSVLSTPEQSVPIIGGKSGSEEGGTPTLPPATTTHLLWAQVRVGRRCELNQVWNFGLQFGLGHSNL